MKDGRRKPRLDVPSGRALLERWIALHHLSQAEAAVTLGVPASKLNEYLHAEKRPSLATAVRIEDVAGIGVRTWLVDELADVAK
jgi:plasmid maintenance system antidote protein VapI